MTSSYDVIIIGLGAMGSATAYHSSLRGQRVLGLDRFQPPHQFGSSHGLTRIIREAYFEHPSYVPLVQRAYDLWANLETKSGRKLYQQTGGLMIGPPDGVLVTGSIRSATDHHLPHEVLSAKELRTRFPVFQPEQNMVAVWEPRAGILFPELAVQTHLELAAQNGAVFKTNATVQRWEAGDQGVQVFTSDGSYSASRLVIAAGAWTPSLLPDLKLPLQVERQVLFWFQPLSLADRFHPDCCPIYIWEYASHRFFYGFPDLGEGVKVAIHHEGESINPDQVQREISEEDISRVRSVLRQFMPAVDGQMRSAVVCMYTNTTDEHFILDYHPSSPRVLVLSPCSGHGFKFSSVVGEQTSRLLANETPSLDLTLFKLTRPFP